MDDNTEAPDPETADIDTDTETDPLPSEKDLQDADGDTGIDDGSTPDADSLTTFLPHGLRLN